MPKKVGRTNWVLFKVGRLRVDIDRSIWALPLAVEFGETPCLQVGPLWLLWWRGAGGWA